MLDTWGWDAVPGGSGQVDLKQEKCSQTQNMQKKGMNVSGNGGGFDNEMIILMSVMIMIRE